MLTVPGHSAPLSSSSGGNGVILRRATLALDFSTPSAPRLANSSAFDPKFPPAMLGARELNKSQQGYLPRNARSITLPSRLSSLGSHTFKLFAVLRSLQMGNTVVGFAPKWDSKLRRPINHLYVLPWIFSKSAARMLLFLVVLAILLFVLFVVYVTGVVAFNIGTVWVLGTLLALWTMYQLASFRRIPDGTIAFCRSLGPPVTEEFFFSYSWAVQPEDVRTMARALWNNGIGVWIDVIKLSSGDSIQVVVRSFAARCNRVVVFLSPEYCNSMNCCVELAEAVKRPGNLIVCVLRTVDPSIMEYLRALPGITIVEGITQLTTLLDSVISRTTDFEAYNWWRSNEISQVSIPTHVVPNETWNSVPKFSMLGKLETSTKALHVGPVYVSGDLTECGIRFFPPILFITALLGVAICFLDIYIRFDDASIAAFDLVWLLFVAVCNLAPFVNLSYLFETRTSSSVSLKPLLASKAINGGCRVRIMGNDSDPIVRNLKHFLNLIGHLEVKGNTKLKDINNRSEHLRKGSAPDVEALTSVDSIDTTLPNSILIIDAAQAASASAPEHIMQSLDVAKIAAVARGNSSSNPSALSSDRLPGVVPSDELKISVEAPISQSEANVIKPTGRPRGPSLIASPSPLSAQTNNAHTNMNSSSSSPSSPPSPSPSSNELLVMDRATFQASLNAVRERTERRMSVNSEDQLGGSVGAPSPSNVPSGGMGLASIVGAPSGGLRANRAKTLNPVINVYVMNSIADRNKLFGIKEKKGMGMKKMKRGMKRDDETKGDGEDEDEDDVDLKDDDDEESQRETLNFDPSTSVLLWSGSMDQGGPFTPDKYGTRIQKFLLLVAEWDKQLLAENLFSAIGVRVVEALHGSYSATRS